MKGSGLFNGGTGAYVVLNLKEEINLHMLLVKLSHPRGLWTAALNMADVRMDFIIIDVWYSIIHLKIQQQTEKIEFLSFLLLYINKKISIARLYHGK